MPFVDRIAAEARQLKPFALILTVLAFPFYVLGWVAGFCWTVVLYGIGAVRVGFSDARRRAAVRGAG